MGNVLDGLADHVTDKSTENGASKSGELLYAASEMKGWRDTMEDCHTLCTDIPVEGADKSLDDHSLFAVYDGHGGGFTSAYAGNNFVRIFSERNAWKKYAELSKEEQSDVTGIELLRKALRGTFLALDDELRNQQIAQNESLLTRLSSRDSEVGKIEEVEVLTPLRIERSGSTIVVVLVTPSHIICANAGDSRAILHQGTRALPLSFDHKPSNVAELERIVSAGGYVKGRRVDGDLAVSRGLGDFLFKSEERLPAHKQRVVAVPDFIVFPREIEKDKFIVLACDGVWDVVSNDDCAKMIQEILDEGESDLGMVCEEILDTCLEKNSRDNMTIITVALPATKLSKESSNAVWTRRTSRKARLLELQARIAAQSAGAGLGLNLGLLDAPSTETLSTKTGTPVASFC